MRLLLFVLFAALLPTSARATNVSGRLTANTTWTSAGNPWVLTGDVTVAPGVTLTLQPGTQVTFATTDSSGSGADWSRTELIVNGSLIAQGTSTSPVTLTATGAFGVRILDTGYASFDSVTLDAGRYGIINNGSAALRTSTIQGAENYCLSVAAGTLTFDKGTLRNCGRALSVDPGANTSLRDSLVQSSGAANEFAISVYGSAQLVHNTITGNVYGAIRVNDFSGTVNISDNIITSNATTGILFANAVSPTRTVRYNNVWGHSTNDYSLSTVTPGPGSISANPLFVGAPDFRITENSPARFAASDGSDLGAFPYAGHPTPTLQGVLFASKTLTGANTLAGDLTVRTGVTLTLAPGASLTFATSDGLRSGVDTARTELIVDGTLTSQGTQEAPVTLTATGAFGVRIVSGSATFDFTHIQAGLYGVFTNGASTFTRTSIQGASTACLIVGGGTTSFSQGTLQNCATALSANAGTTEMRYSLVRASGVSSRSQYAVYVQSPTRLIHNTVANNLYGGVQLASFTGTVELFDNVITSNGLFGINAASATLPTRSVHHNDVWGHSTRDVSTNVPLGPGSLSANPLLVSASDFHPTENSPVRMAASDGTDLGAFEHAGDPTPSLQGVLFANRTLTGANTLDGDLTVRAGVTLTLAPGASLTFATSDGLRSGVDTARTELIVDGTLAAQGTREAPITLTATGAYGVRVQGSAAIDFATLQAGLYGVVSSGNTLVDHTTLQGASTQCLLIAGGTASFSHGTLRNCAQALVTTGGTTTLGYTVVHASGVGSQHAIVLGAPATLVHNTVARNNYGAVRVASFVGTVSIYDNLIASNGDQGISFAQATTPTRSVHHNDVWGHGIDYAYVSTITPGPGSFSANPLLVSASDFHPTENSPVRFAASDGTDLGALTYAGDPTPSLQGVLYSDRTLTGAHTLDGDLTVHAGATLTLAPGASLTFGTIDGQRSGLDTARIELIVEGALATQGAPNAPVTLTATGAYGVRVLSTGSVTFDFTTVQAGIYGVVSSGHALMEHTTLQGASTECLSLTGGSTSFSHGTLRNCTWALIATGGTLSLDYSLVHANGPALGGWEAAAVILGAPATLVHNTIVGNATGGVFTREFVGAVDFHDNAFVLNESFDVLFRGLTAPTRVFHHNNAWNPSIKHYENTDQGPGGLSANPLLVSATDFHPTENSPIRFAASDGTDMGAFAYSGAPTPSLQGVLYSDKTLSGAITLDGDLTVRAGVTLTLAPGASLTFPASDGQRSGLDREKTELIIGGTLAVQGTRDAPVTLTATSAYGVRVLSTGSATFDFTTVHAGLYGVASAGNSVFRRSTLQGGSTQCLLVTGGTTLFSHGTLQSCRQALWATGGTTDLRYSLVRTSGTTSNSIYAIDVRGGASAQLVHNTITDNLYDGVYVRSDAGSVSVFDNIMTSGGYRPFYSDSTTAPRAIHHNDVWTYGRNWAPSTPLGSGGISANPLYVSDSDFRLTEFSPGRLAASDGTDMGAFPYEGHPSPGLMGVLVADTVLTGDNTLIGDLTIRPGVTLTLAPGASLTFAGTDALWAGSDKNKIELIIDGHLDARGTRASPVTLTATGASGVYVRGSATFDLANIHGGEYGVVSTGESTFQRTTIQGATSTCLVVSGGTSAFRYGTLQNCGTGFTTGNADLARLEYSLVRANHGGVVLSSPAFILHNTITGNTASGVNVYGALGVITIADNIISSNGQQGIFFLSPSYPSRSVSHNNVWGHASADYVNVTPGPGSLSTDPLFVDAEDFSLQATSPCRDAASDGSDMGAFPFGPPRAASVVVAPTAAILAVQGTQAFTATAYDTFGDPLPGAAITWSAQGTAGTIDASGLFTAGCTPGPHPGAVTASVNGQSASATVTLTPGPAARVMLTPATASLSVNDTQQFTASVRDACDNPLPSAPVSWLVAAGGGDVSPDGVFTAGTVAGEFPQTLQALSGALSASASVTVNPGPVQAVRVTPASVNLRVRGTQRFTATATDAWGNAVPGTPAWSVSSTAVGGIDADGVFTAGGRAGAYPGAVTARFDTVGSSADVTLAPGDLARIVVTPAVAHLGPNDEQLFSAKGEDAEGNDVPFTPVWSAVRAAGSITQEGRFTATPVAGTYAASVLATAQGLSGAATVVVAPGALHRLVLSPQNPTVVVQGKVAFSVMGYDAYDNALSLTPTWEAVNGGGTLDPSGVFTAGLHSGTFSNTVRVTAGGQSASTSVTVADDSDSDGMADEWELAHGFDPNNPEDAALDADDDAFSNVAEFEAETDPHDADTDDDGVLDGHEPSPTSDTDGDGLPNVRDPDSDNDGLFDGTELAVTSPHAGTDVSKGQFVADADPETTTDPLSADTDGDGRKDGDEDANHNGQLDEGETDPNTPDAFCELPADCAGGEVCQEGLCVDAPPAPDEDPPEHCGCGGTGPSASVLGLLLLSLHGLVNPRRKAKANPSAGASRG